MTAPLGGSVVTPTCVLQIASSFHHATRWMHIRVPRVRCLGARCGRTRVVCGVPGLRSDRWASVGPGDQPLKGARPRLDVQTTREKS